MIDEDARNLAIGAARAADDAHATDIIVLHVGDVLGVTEYFVIASASNQAAGQRRRRRHRSTIEGRRSSGAPIRVEGVREQQWVLIDYGDVIVHVFLSEIRDFYEIERLYTDVPKVDWQPA